MLSMQHESAIKKQSLITPIATEIMGDEIRNNGQQGGGSEELKRELTTTKNHTFIPAIPIPLLVQKEIETDATDKMEEVQPDLLHSRLTNGINVHRHRKQTSNDMEIVNGDEYIYTYPSKADSPIPSSSPSSPDTYTPPRIGLRLSGGGGSSTNLSVYMASVGARDNGVVGRGNRLSTSAPPIPFIRKLSESTMLMNNNNLSSSPNSSPSTSPNSSSTNLAMRTIERRTSNLRIDTSSLSCHSPDSSSTSSSPTLFSPLATTLSSSSSGHSRTLSRPTTPTLTQLDAISLGLSSPRSGGSPRSGSPDSPRSMLPRSASDHTPRKKTADDFILGRVLGEGSYGAVVEGTDRETGAVYAIKILEKNHILKEKKEKYVRTERDILGRCFHPGIVKLFYTFRSEHSLYYVLELAPNGELLGLIKQYGGLHEKCVQFYAAELVEVLEYLHSKGIVHRDLKPENILLSADYHLKLTDFGTAKLLGTERNARSNSFVGTAAYVSPELITSKETCCASDLWALGNIIYQMLAVRLPFRGKTDFLTFQSVSARKFSFPLNFPPLAKDLIENLFALNPEERIGARAGGYEELKSHPFFAGINWATLREQQPPPHKGSAVELIFDDLTPPPSPTTQLFRTTSSGFLSPIFSNSPSSPRGNNAETRKWGQFLNQNEAVTHAGLVWKRKGLSIKKRYLILTNAPRLLYIEPKKLVLRGEIPFSEHLHPELKNSANFYIHTPKRKYILEDTTNNAQKWVDAIQSVVTAFKDEVKSVLQ